jgi:recombinational DNA repair protein RecR
VIRALAEFFARWREARRVRRWLDRVGRSLPEPAVFSLCEGCGCFSQTERDGTCHVCRDPKRRIEL